MKCMKKLTAGAVALGLGGVIALSSLTALASDHTEAPTATALPAADIADYYAWHDADTLNLILTFSPFPDAGAEATYDSNILYTLHFDTTGDNLSDAQVYARFGEDSNGVSGIQISGIGDAEVVGAVETVITDGDVSVFAGFTDDPFFFDLEGLTQTGETGTLSFDPMRDSFAGANITSIAIQAPLSSIVGDVTSFQTWATTGSSATTSSF